MSTGKELLHVMPDLRVSGCYSTMLRMIKYLNRSDSCFTHKILFEGNPYGQSDRVLWAAQEVAGNVVNVGSIDADVLKSSNAQAAILYNVKDKPGIGKALPSVYYSYGVYDAATCPDTVVACSEFARRWQRDKTEGPGDRANIVPPALDLYELQGMDMPAHEGFRVGILTSGYANKYPDRQVMQLLVTLPPEAEIWLSTVPAYKHPGVDLAIASRLEYGKTLQLCPVSPYDGIRYASECDVVICCSHPDHLEPAGLLALEAMTMGKVVICENAGAYKDIIMHGHNGLLFDNIDEVPIMVEYLMDRESEYTKLSNMGRLAGYLYDTGMAVNLMETALYEVGV